MSTKQPRNQALGALTLLPLCLCLIAATAQAGKKDLVFDTEPVGPHSSGDPEKWKEGRVTLPPWPKDADLIEVEPEHVSDSFRYFIDGAHLNVDNRDEIVRYTLVVEDAKGHRNVSFEGIRCTLHGHYRTYAYGVDGRFNRTGGSDWQVVPVRGSMAYLEDLFTNRFCVPRGLRPRTKKDILRALNDRGSADNSAFFLSD